MYSLSSLGWTYIRTVTAGMHSAPAIARHPSSYNEAGATLPFRANKTIQALEGNAAAIAAFLAGRAPRSLVESSGQHDGLKRQHSRQKDLSKVVASEPAPRYPKAAPDSRPHNSSQARLAPMRAPQQPSQQPVMVVKPLSAHPQPHPHPAHKGQNPLPPTFSESEMAVPPREAGGATGNKKKGKKAVVREAPRVGSGRFSPLGHIRA